jgi:thiosulfate reductase / polysulfide reductase chain A
MHRVGASPSSLWRAILAEEAYPVKALINWESDPLQWAANTRKVYDAMKSPNSELYVVNDFWMTPSALLADYVLPAASWMEGAYADTFEDFRDAVVGGEKAVEPLGERKDNYDLFMVWPGNQVGTEGPLAVGNHGRSHRLQARTYGNDL